MGSVITKAFELLTAIDDNPRVPLPVASDYPAAPTGGMYGLKKVLAGGTFCVSSCWKSTSFVQSARLSLELLLTKCLIPGSNGSNKANAVMRFKHDFGVRLLSKWRANEFSWDWRFLDDGTKNSFSSKTGSMLLVLKLKHPQTLTGVDMWDPVAGSTSANSGLCC